MLMRSTSAIVLASFLAAAPALAQTADDPVTLPDGSVTDSLEQPAPVPDGMDSEVIAPEPVDPAAPATAAMPEGFAPVDVGGVTAEELQGVDVYDPTGSEVANIHDVQIGSDAVVTGVIMDVGGFLGIGEHRVALTTDQVELYGNADGDLRALVSLSKDELKALPKFEEPDDTMTDTVTEPAPADPVPDPGAADPDLTPEPMEPGLDPAGTTTPADPALSEPGTQDPADYSDPGVTQ